MYNVLVDHNLMESIRYPDDAFPFGVFHEDYSALTGNTLNCHWHADLEFDLVLRGGVEFTLNGRTVPLGAGQCLFINAGTLHTAKQLLGEESALILGVAFKPALFTKEYAGTAFQRYFRSQGDGVKWDAATREGEEVVRLLSGLQGLDRNAFGYELECLAVMSRVWLHTAARLKEPECCPSPGVSVAPVKKMLSYIYDRYQEKVAIEDLAGFAGTSRSQCFQQFKQYTGQSPIAYLNNFRLSKAAAMLGEPGYNVTEVCYACGFTDVSYFIKTFREKFGVPPMRYKKRLDETESH